MIAALLVYFLCALSGWSIERGTAIDSLLKRVLLVVAVAIAQLVFLVQLLSIFHALNGLGLMIAVIIFTALVVLMRRKSVAADRIGWRELTQNRWQAMRNSPKHLSSIALLLVGASLLLVAIVASGALVPWNDSYHFEMPIFWMQHQTIYPFPVYNPRIPALSFLSEAAQLPGYLYARSIYTTVVAGVLTGTLCLWTIFALARRVGASCSVAMAVTGVTIGLTAFTSNLQQAAAEMFLAGIFVGGSLLFLFDLKKSPLPARDIAWSVFLFAMACGAKNSTTLLGPAYLIVLFAASRRVLAAGFFSKFAGPIVGAGLVGLICSGVAWNYSANKIWFKNSGLPRLIAETVSHNFRPREIWTREIRGAVQFVADSIWMPKSLRARYANAVEGTTKILGAQKELREDGLFYFFEAAPARGYGILGSLLLVPALVVGLIRGGRALMAPKPVPDASFATASLTFLAIAAFFMVHLVLRWQSIGLLRLMFPFAALAAPLTALLLERKMVRAAALFLLFITAALVSVYSIGLSARRLDLAERPLFRKIATLQNDRSYLVRYQWAGKEAREYRVREDYTQREIHRLILSGLQQPATIGVIGHGNTESVYLFGDRFQNRIVPLVDCREEQKILDLPAKDLDYVIVLDKFDVAKTWAAARGFESVFDCVADKGQIAQVFKRAR
ncbi:MAG TPA: hypothetical protein VM680_13605 [Verrucomicrobiae bacterium]|nr:hypothetical protein [Verrucomicrobiae bacterium]